MSSALGRKVNELRRGKGMSLDALATATASSKSYMWELENKAVAKPSAEKLSRIAAALDVTPEFLLDDERTSPAEDEADEAFYRKYQSLDDGAKSRIRRILKALEEDD